MPAPATPTQTTNRSHRPASTARARAAADAAQQRDSAAGDVQAAKQRLLDAARKRKPAAHNRGFSSTPTDQDKPLHHRAAEAVSRSPGTVAALAFAVVSALGPARTLRIAAATIKYSLLAQAAYRVAQADDDPTSTTVRRPSASRPPLRRTPRS